MNSTVGKWGNSLALRLPKSIADALQLSEGAAVKITVADGAFTVTPRRPTYTLDEMLQSEPTPGSISEVDWADAQGKEAW